jgi:outer membrane protein TolC
LLSPSAQPRLDNVNPVAWLIVAAFLPTAAVFALIGMWRWARRLAEARYKAPPAQPLGRLQADLRRLRAELEDTESRSRLTAKNHRIRALRGAYVDALSAACQRLDVSPPGGGDRAPLTEIYRVEAALRQRGLDVRQDVQETAAH